MLLFVLVLVTACVGEREQGLDVEFELSPLPPRTGSATYLLGLSEAGAPLHGATVRVEGNMNHAGMVPVFSEATEVEPGQYSGQLEFSMAGDWFLIVTAETEDGRQLSSTVDVPRVLPRKKLGQ